MPFEPVNVFSHHIDPAGVLEVARRVASSVEIDGGEDDWTQLVANVEGVELVVGHSRAYYAGPGWSKQVAGMAGSFARFPEAPKKREVLRAIHALRFALSFPRHDLDIDGDDPRVELVYAICRRLDGVIFTPSALRDAEGRFLLSAHGEFDPDAIPPATAAPARQPAMPPGVAPVRRANLERLAALGFTVALGLPFDTGRAKRPLDEIARRLMALDALFTWVSANEENAAAARVRAYAERNGLVDAMTDDEREIFALDRAIAHRDHVSAIGWRLENMWPLAWVLGFSEEPPLDQGMIGEPTIRAIGRFLPSLDGSSSELLARCAPRPDAEVDALEDLFYCAHNAVRSAQLGDDTVPPGFHPVADGGVVHERRHALTWTLSPGVAWDETDLST